MPSTRPRASVLRHGREALEPRVRGLFLLVLALSLFAAGCEDRVPAAPPRGGNASTPPSPALVPRPRLEVPEEDPDAEAKIRFYLTLLERGHLAEVAWASEQLGEAGESAVAPLASELERALRKNSLYAENLLRVLIHELRAGSIAPLLATATRSSDGPVRVSAARALGASGAPEAVAPLLDLVGGGIDPLAEAAILAIDELGREEGYRGLLGRFPDRVNPRAGRLAVGVLDEALPAGEAVAFLRATLENESPELALAAGAALLERDAPSHLAAVRERFAKERGGPYERVIRGVLARGRDGGLVARLIREAASGRPALAIPAIDLLSHYRSEEARQGLWKAAAAKDRDLRLQALHSLLAMDAPRALDRLIALLESPEAGDRMLAALVLAAHPREPAIEPLVAALDRETDSGVRRKLLNSVALVAGERGAKALAETLGRETETEPSLATTAHGAANALLLLELLPGDAVDALLRLAGHGSPAIRMNVARLLGPVCDGEEVAEVAAVLLADPSADVRRMALESWVDLEEAGTAPLIERYAAETEADIVPRVRQVIDQIRHRWRP